MLATDGRHDAVGSTLAAGTWPSPGVLFVGPAGSGKSTLLRAISHRLELSGATVTRGDEALGTAPTPTSVATVDERPLHETVVLVASLIEAGWRVMGTTLGPTPQVGVELGALCDTGLVLLVELRSLPTSARRDVLRSELNDADPAAVELMSRCGPGDGRALRVLPARARARAGLAGGPVDVGAAAAALRGGLRASQLGPPVPRLIRDLMKLRSPGSPAAVVSSLAEGLRPLSVLGPAEQAVVDVTAGAPVAIAGGVESAVALRIALHHALRGRRVLLQTSTLSEPRTVDGLVRLATGRDRPDRDSDGLASELVAGLSPRRPGRFRGPDLGPAGNAATLPPPYAYPTRHSGSRGSQLRRTVQRRAGRCTGRGRRLGETGFRAERAHPVLLHLGSAGTHAQRLALSARYGCEVTGGRQA